MKRKKFKSIVFNNRKKQLKFVYMSGREILVHYSSLGIKKNIKGAWVDKETRGQSIGFEFEDNTTDYMPYDQPLYVIKDPQFLLQQQIEFITAKINKEIIKQKISKRYLANMMKTSDNQIQRLLNPDILNKNLEQLFKIASILNLEFSINLKKAA